MSTVWPFQRIRQLPGEEYKCHGKISCQASLLPQIAFVPLDFWGRKDGRRWAPHFLRPFLC